MDTITEVFLEAWDDAQQACQKCKARVAELQSQGFHCSIGLFYNALNGKRIYILEATISPVSDSEVLQQTVLQRSRSPRSSRPKPRSTAYQNL